MDSEDTAQMTLIREGCQETMESESNYLDSIGIDNLVTWAEDAQPDQ